MSDYEKDKSQKYSDKIIKETQQKVNDVCENYYFLGASTSLKFCYFLIENCDDVKTIKKHLNEYIKSNTKLKEIYYDLMKDD